MDWHSNSLDAVFDKLGTNRDGLSSDDADSRIEEYGRNEITDESSTSPLKILISQFQDFLIYLLIIAAILSLGVGFLPGHEPEYVDAALILLILVANGIFGFVQDYKAEKSIQALKDLSTPKATVLRDGEKKEVDSREIVPGDVVFLKQGDAVPADARLIESENLNTDESALTGESTTVSKNTDLVDEDAAIADRKNMVYMNTTVTKGRGKAVVVGTGMETQVGNIAEQIQQADDKETPFQREVDELGEKIGYGIIAIIGIVAVTQYFFTSASIVSIILVSITLAVAAVPEGLPAVVTLTLALGSKKMLEKDSLVRRLPVVESLGSVDVIVTDKTGTLTEDLMTVQKIYHDGKTYEVTGGGTSTDGKFMHNGETADPSELAPILLAGVTNNNAEKAPDGEDKEYYGDPTEVALLISAAKAQVNPESERTRSVPFSSDRKRMTVVTEDGNAYMKGAPEVVLERCEHILIDGEEKELTEDLKRKILDKNSEFAGEALRVLGFAQKKINGEETDDELESGMTFLGLQGMIDPTRSEVKDAVNDCRTAGVRVVMATGDNIETAKAIGEKIGFNPEGAMTGNQVEEMTDEELQEKVKDVEIFARVSPEHKVRILQALKANGHNVAMTGDGVNDAPALKNSDVGVAMGVRGTDVAKQSSDMVLQDDNFVTIRDAVAEGRGIFDNIRKFVNYLLSANAGEIMVVFFGIMIGTMMFPEVFRNNPEALILTPVMLLWINFVTDGLPALALGADPKSDGIMSRPPRPPGEPVINKRMMASILGMGALMAVTGLPLFFYAITKGATLIEAQTLLFTFLVTVEMARIQTIRQRYNQSILSNKWLLAALASSFLLQLMVLYTPLNKYFGTVPLGLNEWGMIGVATLGFVGLSYGLAKAFDTLME